MAWPFDTEGGDPISRGLLAGQKLKAMRKDLQLAELQRKQAEQEIAYRATKNALEIGLSKTAQERQDIGLQIDQLQRQALEFAATQQPTEAAINQARRASTESSARVATATESDQISTSRSAAALGESQAAGSQLDLLNRQIDLAGRIAESSQEFGPEDLQSLVDQLGIKDPKGQAIIGRAMISEIEQIRRSREVLLAQTDQLRKLNEFLSPREQRAESESLQAQVREYMAFEPEALQRLAEADPDNRALRLAIAAQEGGGLQERRGIDPVSMSMIESNIKQISQKRDRLSELEDTLSGLEGVDIEGWEVTGSPSWLRRAVPFEDAGKKFLDRDTKVKGQREADRLRREITSLQDEISKLQGRSGTPDRKAESKPASLREALKQQNIPIPGKDVTDNELRQRVRVLKSRGIDTTFEALRDLRDNQ